MAKSKTERRRSADPAPRRTRAVAPAIEGPAPAAIAAKTKARAKPTAEQLTRLASMRRRLQRAELELVGIEALDRIAPPAGPPIRRRDPIADQLAALRSIETARADEWARFDEAAERLADELARRWRLDLAAAFGNEDHEQLIADFVERQRAELLADARIELHKLTEWPGDNSPEGCLALVRRARAWCGDEPPLEIRLSDEGRETLARLTAEPPRPAGADDLQLEKLCTYLAELPAGERVQLAELRRKLPERWPGTRFTRDSIDKALARGKDHGYIDRPDRSSGLRSGSKLTAQGQRFVVGLSLAQSPELGRLERFAAAD